MQRIIGESHLQARRLLSVHRRQLDALVKALLERETLDQREILEITRLAPAPTLLNLPLPVGKLVSRGV